ncbi:MAG: hypothetical protein FWD61_20190, partial [Phycisphaerales bacterium]|nr:hypothetical protein [Phycisphaerales bacterium]
MSDTRKSRRSTGGKSKRGVHPPQYRNGNGHHGSLTIVTPAADVSEDLDTIQVEYVTSVAEAPPPPPPPELKQTPPEPAASQLASAISGEPEAITAPIVESHTTNGIAHPPPAATATLLTAAPVPILAEIDASSL